MSQVEANWPRWRWPRFAPRRLAHQAHGRVDALQGRCHGALQLRARARQFYGAGVAQEQRQTHLVLQRLDLAAHGRLRERQFLQPPRKLRCRATARTRAVARRHGAGAQQGGRRGRADMPGLIDAVCESIAYPLHWTCNEISRIMQAFHSID